MGRVTTFVTAFPLMSNCAASGTSLQTTGLSRLVVLWREKLVAPAGQDSVTLVPRRLMVKSERNGFVAVTAKPDLPGVVGVPPSDPLLASVRPGGNVPLVTEKVYGALPPLAAIVWL